MCASGFECADLDALSFPPLAAADAVAAGTGGTDVTVIAARSGCINGPIARSEYRLQSEVIQGLQPRSHDPFFQEKRASRA